MCHTYRYAVAAVLAVVMGTLLALLLAAVVAEYNDTLLRSRSQAGGVAASGEDSAAAPNNEAGHGDFLMPISKYDSRRDKEADTPEEAYTAQHNEVEEVTGNVGVEEAMPDREDGTQLHSGARKGQGANGNAGLDKWESAACGGPAFRFCSGGPAEFFYNGTARACMTLTPDGPGLCNHGRNRFTSLEDCWEQCVDNGEPVPECFLKAVFAECEAGDIVHTWWWYLDGKGCRHWRFPRGECPSMEGGNVFRTASECVRRCVGAKGRKSPCIAPKGVPCNVKQMRFGYVADTSPHGARRCRELPSASGGAKVRHCLAGANKFPTLEACQRRCVNA